MFAHLRAREAGASAAAAGWRRSYGVEVDDRRITSMMMAGITMFAHLARARGWSRVRPPPVGGAATGSTSTTA